MRHSNGNRWDDYRGTMASQSKHERISRKDETERALKEHLKECGLWSHPGTTEQDKHDKIDGYLKTPKGGPGSGKHSVQLKQRENGADIIFEVDDNIEVDPVHGRDYISKAFFFCCRDPHGNVALVKTSDLRVIADRLLEQYPDRRLPGFDEVEGRSPQLSFGGAKFQNTSDPREGTLKLMGFFPKSLFGTIMQAPKKRRT